MAKRQVVAALPEEETLAFFERLHLRGAYENAELVCSICGEPLSEAGLGAVRAGRDGQLVFACSKLDCLDDLSR